MDVNIVSAHINNEKNFKTDEDKQLPITDEIEPVLGLYQMCGTKESVAIQNKRRTSDKATGKLSLKYGHSCGHSGTLDNFIKEMHTAKIESTGFDTIKIKSPTQKQSGTENKA